MTKEEIIEKVNPLLAEEFEVEESDITPDAVIKDALELDSLSLVDLVAVIEHTFKVKIPAADLPTVKTFEDLYNALKDNPKDTVKNGVAGIGSSGYNAVMVLSSTDATMGKCQNISYAGGADAVKALLAGEVDFTSQLSNEMIDLLRSGDLVALCALTADDLKLDGVAETVPSIKRFIPELEKNLPIGDAFGLLFPSDVPDATKAELEKAFVAACKTDSVKAFANEKGMVLLGATIAESNKIKDDAAVQVGFILYDLGVAKRSPEDLGYKRP